MPKESDFEGEKKQLAQKQNQQKLDAQKQNSQKQISQNQKTTETQKEKQNQKTISFQFKKPDSQKSLLLLPEKSQTMPKFSSEFSKFSGTKNENLVEFIKQYEIGFWIDSYDDLFSDFDPRPYSKRQISDDFLSELRRRFRETPKGGFEVNFYVPNQARDAKTEAAVKKKIRDYFSFEAERLSRTQTERRKTGVGYFFAGFFILSLNAYIEWEFSLNRPVTLFGFLLAPAGWFSMWNSIERILISPQEENERLDFFAKMQKCNFIFSDLEDANKTA